MTEKISSIQTRIFYTLELIPTLHYSWGNFLYKTYKSILDDSLSINETDAKDLYIFDIFSKNIWAYSGETLFLENLKNSQYITPSSRAEVIGKLNSLDFAIKTATE